MKQQPSAQKLPHYSTAVWVMSFISVLLVALAVAAATRLPHYLATADYVRLTATGLFNMIALAGLADNIHTHYLLWQQKNRAESTQLAPQR